MNKKGFTLIELLAVIIILGILMIIAIPSVTSYINESRKSSYVDTAKQIISGARNFVNEGKEEMFSTDTTYYINASCIKTENGTRSPYGEFDKAYVVVTYDGQGYTYYWTSVDETGQGVKDIIKSDKLDTDNIVSDIVENSIKPNVGIGNRMYIVEFGADCRKVNNEPTVAMSNISESGGKVEGMCPGCVYYRTESYFGIGSPISGYVEDYKDLADYATKPFFGIVLDDSNNSSVVYICSIFKNDLFCINEDINSSKYNYNKSLFKSIYGNYSEFYSTNQTGIDNYIDNNNSGCLNIDYSDDPRVGPEISFVTSCYNKTDKFALETATGNNVEAVTLYDMTTSYYCGTSYFVDYGLGMAYCNTTSLKSILKGDI